MPVDVSPKLVPAWSSQQPGASADLDEAIERLRVKATATLAAVRTERPARGFSPAAAPGEQARALDQLGERASLRAKVAALESELVQMDRKRAAAAEHTSQAERRTTMVRADMETSLSGGPRARKQRRPSAEGNGMGELRSRLDRVKQSSGRREQEPERTIELLDALSPRLEHRAGDGAASGGSPLASAAEDYLARVNKAAQEVAAAVQARDKAAMVSAARKAAGEERQLREMEQHKVDRAAQQERAQWVESEEYAQAERAVQAERARWLAAEQQREAERKAAEAERQEAERKAAEEAAQWLAERRRKDERKAQEELLQQLAEKRAHEEEQQAVQAAKQRENERLKCETERLERETERLLEEADGAARLVDRFGQPISLVGHMPADENGTATHPEPVEPLGRARRLLEEEGEQARKEQLSPDQLREVLTELLSSPDSPDPLPTQETAPRKSPTLPDRRLAGRSWAADSPSQLSGDSGPGRGEQLDHWRAELEAAAEEQPRSASWKCSNSPELSPKQASWKAASPVTSPAEPARATRSASWKTSTSPARAEPPPGQRKFSSLDAMEEELNAFSRVTQATRERHGQGTRQEVSRQAQEQLRQQRAKLEEAHHREAEEARRVKEQHQNIRSSLGSTWKRWAYPVSAQQLGAGFRSSKASLPRNNLLPVRPADLDPQGHRMVWICRCVPLQRLLALIIKQSVLLADEDRWESFVKGEKLELRLADIPFPATDRLAMAGAAGSGAWLSGGQRGMG